MKKERIYDYLSIVMILMISLSLVGTARYDENYNSDILFLYNRVTQLRNMDSFLGVFFYNDFAGLGYGSSFFYGYLTLFPFIWVKDFHVFCNLFTLVSLFMLFLGSRCLVKRFAGNYQFISLLFMSSFYLILLYESCSLVANFYAVGISFFFLAYCVDFLRDKQSFIPASILYFLVLNTHMITAFISLIGCALLCLYYFDKTKIKHYINFFLFTLVICSFFIINFIWHSENVLNLGNGYNGFIDNYHLALETDAPIFSCLGTSPNIFGGFINLLVEKRLHLTLLSPIVALLGLYLFIKSKPKKRNVVLMICILLSFIISIHYIWMFLYEKFRFVIQFPTRYLFYTLLVFLILCFRNKSIKLLGIYSIVLGVFISVLCTNASTSVTYMYNPASAQVANGEYLSPDFPYDDTEKLNHLVFDCEFEYKKDSSRYTEIYVTEETSEWFHIPKLWYKGYKAVTEDGKEVKLRMGEYQFIEINPEGYVGTVTVYYAHTWWLYALEVFCDLLVIFHLGKLLLKFINNKYTFFGRSLLKNRKEISNE